jgi:parallel beta-helix repeat protein
LFILWLALSTLTVIKFTGIAKADPIIPAITPMEHAYIRSNGDVDPPTLPIQRSGFEYVLKDNILNYSIEIQKDNVILDGNGFSLTLPADVETEWGMKPKTGDPLVQISNKDNIIVKNIKADNYFTGISVKNSSNVVIIQNTLTGGRLGIYMFSSRNCSIIGNKLIENSNIGLRIQKSAFFNIAYNTISKNYFGGGEISGISYSNISRNDVIENFLQSSPGLGLSLTGSISGNRIFENNFVNNYIGLDFHCFENSSDNVVYNNYWSNYQHQIFDYRGYAIGGVDQSPLESPISTSFDPSLFPLPSLTPDAPSEADAQSDAEPFPTALVAAASVATIALVGVGLLVYLKRKR